MHHHCFGKVGFYYIFFKKGHTKRNLFEVDNPAFFFFFNSSTGYGTVSAESQGNCLRCN